MVQNLKQYRLYELFIRENNHFFDDGNRQSTCRFFPNFLVPLFGLVFSVLSAMHSSELFSFAFHRTRMANHSKTLKQKKFELQKTKYLDLKKVLDTAIANIIHSFE